MVYGFYNTPKLTILKPNTIFVNIFYFRIGFKTNINTRRAFLVQLR